MSKKLSHTDLDNLRQNILKMEIETQLQLFVMESNKIEGIVRHARKGEIEELERFIALDEVTIDELVKFVKVYEPGAQLRSKESIPNVRIGNHIAPKSGVEIRKSLKMLLFGCNNRRIRTSGFGTHKDYETLHPFTDCNGRSGRALWLWCMRRAYNDDDFLVILKRGFLHAWYYDSLSY